jgi:hypothetical protein
MKEQIDKLTEKQAKDLLFNALQALEHSVYAETHEVKMACAENLGVIKSRIETLSNEK